MSTHEQFSRDVRSLPSLTSVISRHRHASAPITHDAAWRWRWSRHAPLLGGVGKSPASDGEHTIETLEWIENACRQVSAHTL